MIVAMDTILNQKRWNEGKDKDKLYCVYVGSLPGPR